MLRSPCELRIWPKSEEVMVCEAGLGKIGRIRQVEGFGADLEPTLLAHVELLAERQVEAAHSRTPDDADSRRCRMCGPPGAE